MTFNILTLFPEIITSYTGESILKRAQAGTYISINAVNIRDFANDKHHTVDDTPYGGGAGMIMKPEPIYEALKSIDALPYKSVRGVSKLKKIVSLITKTAQGGSALGGKKTIYLSPRGRQFDQRMAEEWASLSELTLICGRYEGIDHRVVDHMIDEEVSIGPYVLAGGELGALVLIEAISRNIPGVLGNPESLLDETHNEHIDAEYPQYTRPQTFLGWSVPDVLMSGDHKKISDWRKEQSNNK
jgi:tRNA (guanine37-N1)-methyltransferase